MGTWCQKHPEAERECGSGWHNRTLAMAENEKEVGIKRMALRAGKKTLVGVRGLFLKSTHPFGLVFQPFLHHLVLIVFWLPCCVASSPPELLKGFGAARHRGKAAPVFMGPLALSQGITDLPYAEAAL